MIYGDPKYKNTTNHTRNVLAGMVFGGMVGALTMLLLAPQSGKDIRSQIREKSIQLRGRTTEMLEDTIEQVRTNANKVTVDVRDYGQELAAEQREKLSDPVQAGKKAIQRS